MPKFQKTGAEITRKHSPQADTRRYSDGVSLHEYLGYILMEGGNDLMRRYPDMRVSRRICAGGAPSIRATWTRYLDRSLEAVT
jgi:hypothetical protein